MMPIDKKFPRGYEFSNFAGQPQEQVIQIEIPARVTIPLRQGFGNEVAAVVEPGQKVAAGQIIGRDDEAVSSPVHSSVNGKVVEIEKIDYLDREIGVVVVESSGGADWQRLEGHSANWEDRSAEEIGKLIYLSGAGSLGKAGIPTGFNSSVIAPEEVENVIIRGVGSEVHNLRLDVLLQGERRGHFVEGLRVLKKVMGRARFHLALNRGKKDSVDEVAQLLPADESISLFTVAPRYPVEYDEVLTPLLLGGEFPYGYAAAGIGVVVLDIQAVLHVYDAVVEGKPLIERTVALCGPGFGETPHVKLRVGSSVEHVVQGKIDVDKDLRLVRNSSLTGESISAWSLPVDRTFSTLVALLEDSEREFAFFMRSGLRKDSYSRTCLSSLFGKRSKRLQKDCGTNLRGEHRPCIFCTFCEEVCPVGIIPHLLFHYVEKDVIDETLLRYKIFNCVECNLCSYVCPSKIPIAEYIKDGKARLIAEGGECPAPGVGLKGMEKFRSVK